MTDDREYLTGYLKGYLDALTEGIEVDLQELRDAHDENCERIIALEKMITEQKS